MLIERYEDMMGVSVGAQLAVEADGEAAARAALDACLVWMREVDERLSRFKPASDLARLNASAGEWVDVPEMLFEVVERALRAAEVTDGLFDPTILPALEAWGYDRDFSAIAHREAALEWSVPNDLVPPGHWREIALDPGARRIRMPAGMRIDLGGIAKGWAADAALDRFFADFPNALVDVGGDLRVRGGLAGDQPWPLAVSSGRTVEPLRAGAQAARPEQEVVVALGSGGAATSGATGRWWLRSGLRAHHVIDPRTARPARIWIDRADDQPDQAPLIASATAFAPTAERAEVEAKAALLKGFPAALESVEAARSDGAEEDASIALLLILGTGAAVFSDNLPDYLARSGLGGNLWLR